MQCGSWSEPAFGTRNPPVAVRRRRSGGQLEVQVGGSTTSRQTATATDALEIDMPPRHQRNVEVEAGDGHVGHCAMSTRVCPNRPRFALRVSKSGLPRAEIAFRAESRVRASPTAVSARGRADLGHDRTPDRQFGVYVHVPFCATRCGYCDFNTYTAAELGGANPDAWLEALRTELRLAADRLGAQTRRHGVRRRRHAVAAGRRPPGRGARRGAGELRPGPRRGGDDRGQPGVDVAGIVRRAAAPPATRGCRSACSRWRRTC